VGRRPRRSELTPNSKPALRLIADDRDMDKTRVIVFASVIAGAMVFGMVLGATAFSRASLVPALAALTATSPSPAFKSNEDPAHERNETPEQEAAENNGAFRPGTHGRPCGGHSNEDAAHEKPETPAEEAAENAACPTPSPRAATSP
jgi:hypothetical protein